MLEKIKSPSFDRAWLGAYGNLAALSENRARNGTPSASAGERNLDVHVSKVHFACDGRVCIVGPPAAKATAMRAATAMMPIQ